MMARFSVFMLLVGFLVLVLTAQDVMQAELSKVLQELPENHKRALGLLSCKPIGDYSE